MLGHLVAVVVVVIIRAINDVSGGFVSFGQLVLDVIGIARSDCAAICDIFPNAVSAFVEGVCNLAPDIFINMPGALSLRAFMRVSIEPSNVLVIKNYNAIILVNHQLSIPPFSISHNPH